MNYTNYLSYQKGKFIDIIENIQTLHNVNETSKFKFFNLYFQCKVQNL